jgi:RNA recognition motif-containing protein
VTFASPADAQDAIDNMDLNELRGKVLRVNLARPSKMPVQGLGNKASASLPYLTVARFSISVQSGSPRNGLNNMRSLWLAAVVSSLRVHQATPQLTIGLCQVLLFEPRPWGNLPKLVQGKQMARAKKILPWKNEP